MQPGFPIRLTALMMARVLANCTTNPVTGKSDFAMMSEPEEVRTGRTEDSKVRKRHGVYDMILADRPSQGVVRHNNFYRAELGLALNFSQGWRVKNQPQNVSAARPLTVRAITARAGLTFAELAGLSPLGKHAEGHLRVINGLYPAGEPVAGQALKIVE